jgi:UDP:flavonoid glycosyltransferase YjiC (YdhE family)
LGRKSSAAKIASAVESVLSEPAFSAAAKRLGAAMEADDAAHAGPDELERLAAG